MEKIVEINSSGEVILDKEIVSILESKGNRLRCVFDSFKILLIPEETTSDKVFASLTDARSHPEYRDPRIGTTSSLRGV